VVILGNDPALRTLNPPLKWAGGKRWLVPRLRELWEPYKDRRLVEPLCGGIAVALGLMPERALLNDINPHNVNFYRWLQLGLTIHLVMENEATTYYQHRAEFNRLVRAGQGETREAAALFYYLNRTGYNGLCRFNKKGEFNVPFGSHKTIDYVGDFRAYVDVFANWDFKSGDFESLALEPDDFIYADPPYDVEFTKYTKEDFTWVDQERLVRWLARHPGPVVLSNQATERIVDLYKSNGFNIEFRQGPRRISCNGDRTSAPEVLATRGL
jgi:DNA adenine methylase